MTFYLKYRPQKIEELDSSSVRETLKLVLSSKKSSFHAFLFTGPKGLGKTSSARIVAKFLNCENRKANDLESCNRCYQCKSTTLGSNLDVVEIDAASNRGIDEIRDLREKINLSTIAAKYKVYIIDEVHMLTTEAFNALLKTLEEPPPHAVFVLCTTEPQKVPATIASRCLHVSFSIATQDELIRSLKRIVSGEKLNVEKEALEKVAKLSDGSFRDGSKILQELSIKAGNRKITKDLVEKEYKVSGIKYYVSSMIGFLEGKNVKGALDLVQKMMNEGTEMKSFVEELTNELHSMLLVKVQEPNAGGMTLEDLKKLFELLMEASAQRKWAVLPQLPLELVIVEYCSVRGFQNTQKTQSFGISESQNVRSSETPIVRQSDSPSIPSFLEELIIKVNTQNRTVAGLLRGVNLKETNGRKVVLETKYKFHKEKLSEVKVRDLIEKMASEILGKNVRIEFNLQGAEH